MNKINNKKIIFSLGIMTILIVGSVLPISASADQAGYVTPYNSTRFNDNVVSNNQYNTYQGPDTSATSTNPSPVIKSINPGSSNIGVGTKTVTITGSGFVPGSMTRINGSNRPATFIDSTHLLMQVNSNDLYTYQSNGGFFITVFNSAPGGGYSNGVFFTVSNSATGEAVGENYTNFTDTNTEGNLRETPEGELAANAIFGTNSFLPSGIIQWVFFAIIVLLIVIFVRRLHGSDKRYFAAPMKHK